MLACAPDAILINWRVRNRRYRFGLVSVIYGVWGPGIKESTANGIVVRASVGLRGLGKRIVVFYTKIR